jgi:hypothetical protein
VSRWDRFLDAVGLKGMGWGLLPWLSRKLRHRASRKALEPDATEQLKKLGELRDAGVLTEQEFKEKKTLLDRL